MLLLLFSRNSCQIKVRTGSHFLSEKKLDWAHFLSEKKRTATLFIINFNYVANTVAVRFFSDKKWDQSNFCLTRNGTSPFFLWQKMGQWTFLWQEMGPSPHFYLTIITRKKQKKHDLSLKLTSKWLKIKFIAVFGPYFDIYVEIVFRDRIPLRLV